MFNMDNSIKITNANDKIIITQKNNPKVYTFKRKSKDPRRGMIERLVKITDAPRDEINGWVRNWLIANPPIKEFSLDKINDLIERRLEEQLIKMEKLLSDLLPPVAIRPASVTSSDEEEEKEEGDFVELGYLKVYCRYDIETNTLYHKGEIIGSVDYLDVDEDADNEESSLSQGYYDNAEECCKDLNDNRILIFRVDLNKISAKTLGEYRAEFKENPYYCTHNFEPNSRYINYKDRFNNWEGFLYKCGDVDDIIKFV